jgi:hypothetical protein
MAMFIECLNIAASPHGYKIISEHESEEHLDCTSPVFKRFAKLYLVESEKNTETINRELIKKRRTSRLQYDGRVLDDETVNSFKAITAEYDHKFVFTSDRSLIDPIILLNSNSILNEVRNDNPRNEMCQWIRTTDKEAETKKDGLWYRCLNTSGRMLYNFFHKNERFAHGWKRKRAEHILTKGMNGSANIAWITGPFEKRSDWVTAGIMLQRLWLQATKHDVFMHPLGTIITTEPAHGDFRRLINYNENDGSLWFLIRLGYSKEPPRSMRLDVKDIVI